MPRPRKRGVITGQQLAKEVSVRTGRPLHIIQKENGLGSNNVSAERAERILEANGVHGLAGPELPPLPHPDTTIGIDLGNAKLGYAVISQDDTGFAHIPRHTQAPNKHRFGRHLMGVLDLKDKTNLNARRKAGNQNDQVTHDTWWTMEQLERDLTELFDLIPDDHQALVAYEDPRPIIARNHTEGIYASMVLGAVAKATAKRGYYLIETDITKARMCLGLPHRSAQPKHTKRDCARKLGEWIDYDHAGEKDPWDAFTIACANAELFGVGLPDGWETSLNLNGYNIDSLAWDYLQAGRPRPGRRGPDGRMYETPYSSRNDPGRVPRQWVDIVRQQAHEWRTLAEEQNHNRTRTARARKAS